MLTTLSQLIGGQSLCLIIYYTTSGVRYKHGNGNNAFSTYSEFESPGNFNVFLEYVADFVHDILVESL
jgi:hypothetical protein